MDDLIQQVTAELNAAYDAMQIFGEPSGASDPRALGTASGGVDASSKSLLWGDDSTFETDTLLLRAVTKIEALKKAKADLLMVLN